MSGPTHHDSHQDSPPPVTLPHTEAHTLRASAIEQDFRLFVSLPADYAQSDEAYPVIYVTDANWFFPLFTVYKLVPMPPIPPLIVVGVGYPTGAFDAIVGLRARDLWPGLHDGDDPQTQTETHLMGAPGSRAFLAFLRGEVFPFVDARYRTQPDDRALWGYSAGGSFAVFTLLHHPDAFQRYIINAPVLRQDDIDCFAYERRYAEGHADLTKRVHFSVGELDELAPNCLEFVDALSARRYPGLELGFTLLKGETHYTGVIASLNSGLSWAFG